MIDKIRLLANTIKYLKPTQIIYQVYYRIKPAKSLAYYLKSNTSSVKLKFNFLVPVNRSVSVENSFNFLNIEHQFTISVNWDYQEHGKLWNYNLQYFNFLHQPDLSDESKLAYLSDIHGWLKEGRLKLEPYPVSLRVINTIRYASKANISLSPSDTDALFAQLNYLVHNLEYHILGNHLLENAFALLMGGYYFKESDWKLKAKSVLRTQLDEQILNDGAHFELSPMYHQIILFRMLELIEWYDPVDEDDEFKHFIRNKAQGMLSWLKTITFHNGDIPHFNDSATGIALSTKELLAYGESLGFNHIECIPLTDSGYRKFSNNQYECIIDAAPIGPAYQPGHSHADALSFILYCNRSPVFVEAGTSTYQIGKRRNYERSTAAHNTIEIGNANQSEVWGGFRVGRRAKTQITKETQDTFEAMHDGYMHNFGTKHYRNFIFEENRIEISDKIGKESGTFFLHCAPSCDSITVNSNHITVGSLVNLTFAGANEISVDDYELADGFNRYQKGKVIAVTFKGQLNTLIHIKEEA